MIFSSLFGLNIYADDEDVYDDVNVSEMNIDDITDDKEEIVQKIQDNQKAASNGEALPY